MLQGYPADRPYREQLASDPDEHDFLATLRATPSDEATRLVYADWLEQRGRVDEAGFVRRIGHGPAAGTAEWRMITARASLYRCERGEECPGRWDLLLATESEDARRCLICCNSDYPRSCVRYAASDHDAWSAGERNQPMALDAAADVRELMHQWHAGEFDMMND